MAAVASPALRLRPTRAASASAPSTSAPPRCRYGSFSHSWFKFARPSPIQRVNGSAMQHLGTLKGQVLSCTGDHDGRFHIKRAICFAATDKQEPVVSLTSDMPVLQETESGTKVTPASENSYFAGRGAGKPGFISFHGSSFQKTTVESVPHPGKEASRLVWFIGPTILVSFLVLPSLYLRKVLSVVFEDSLLTASATLAPYLVGLVVQFAFEQYARHRKSPSWPVIPIIFKVYRLHQLNRAAQLVTALTFSVRGTETTNQTLAIMNSLGALLTVLQILGIICVWSLSSFLMRFLPSSDIPDP